jgi:hypothetical protein
MRERYLVEFDRPPEMSVEDMREYICDALRGWKGGYEKGHPMFGHDLRLAVIRPHSQPSAKAERKLQSIAEAKPWGAVVMSQFVPKDKP